MRLQRLTVAVMASAVLALAGCGNRTCLDCDFIDAGARDRSLQFDVPLTSDLAAPDVPLAPDQKIPDAGPPPGTWVTIKAGTFKMGSPSGENCRPSNETQHTVKLTTKFELMTTEVTQGHFKGVMGYNNSSFSSCGTDCPVENVSWHEAAAYAKELSRKAKIPACYSCKGGGSSVHCTEATSYAGNQVYNCPGYRLPTEAEWEYAYRAGTTTALYNGGITSCSGRDPNLEKIGWYKENSHVSYAGSSSGKGTHPVGQKTPNAWKLYDMSGNVFEWCHDGYRTYSSAGVTDPHGTSGSYRALRGGSWSSLAAYCRAAVRPIPPLPDNRYNNIGFRLARSVP